MLELSHEGPCALLTIRRADKKNALDEAMWSALGEHCARLAALPLEQAPRVLLVQGEPGTFCAGADIEELRAIVGDAAAMKRNNRLIAQAQLALEHLPLPTVAVIDGPCFGGGFGIAAACDFRIGSARASFAITPARLGLVYSVEDTRRVAALVGAYRARRLLMMSERLDADTALAWGVLDALVAPDALDGEARRWAAGLAEQSPASLRGIKATLNHLSGQGVVSEGAARAAFESAFVGSDFAEGAAAFLQRRSPRF
jgi:enoyl-CoA hydratase/carnithine racemase